MKTEFLSDEDVVRWLRGDLSAKSATNKPILLTDKITRTRYKRVGTHWSESPWVSWCLVVAMMAAMFVFGAWGCQRTSLHDMTISVFHAGVSVGQACQEGIVTEPECCDLNRVDFFRCTSILNHAN